MEFLEFHTRFFALFGAVWWFALAYYYSMIVVIIRMSTCMSSEDCGELWRERLRPIPCLIVSVVTMFVLLLNMAVVRDNYLVTGDCIHTACWIVGAALCWYVVICLSPILRRCTLTALTCGSVYASLLAALGCASLILRLLA